MLDGSHRTRVGVAVRPGAAWCGPPGSAVIRQRADPLRRWMQLPPPPTSPPVETLVGRDNALSFHFFSLGEANYCPSIRGCCANPSSV